MKFNILVSLILYIEKFRDYLFMNNADLEFAELRKKQADLDTQENLLKKLNGIKDELRNSFKRSL